MARSPCGKIAGVHRREDQLQNQGNGGGERQDAADGQEEALETALREAEKKNSSRRGKADRYFSDWNNRVGVLTFGVLVIYTLVTGAVWMAQLRANAINNDAYIASSRPWLRLSKAQPVGVNVMDTVAFVTIALQATNTGHSPAEKVYAWGKVYTSLSIPEEAAAVEDACSQGLKQKRRSFQTIIFPDEERPIEERVYAINTDDVPQSHMRWLNDQYAAWVAMFGKSKADAMKEENTHNPLYGVFSVVGCITYTYRNGSATGQTSFILDVDRGCPESPSGCSFDLSHAADYDGKHVVMTEVRRGLFAR